MLRAGHWAREGKVRGDSTFIRRSVAWVGRVGLWDSGERGADSTVREVDLKWGVLLRYRSWNGRWEGACDSRGRFRGIRNIGEDADATGDADATA